MIFLAIIPFNATADFYKYVDDSGTENVTNDISSIPEKYRSGMKVIKDSDLQKKRGSSDRQPEGINNKRRPSGNRQTETESAPVTKSPANIQGEQVADKPVMQQNPGWLDRQLPMLKLGVTIAFFIAIAIFTGKILSAMLPRTLGLVIKIALFVGIIVYVFNGYAKKISDSFAALKSESDVVQKAVDKRSEQIEKQTADH